uniref:DUF834 domain-containing protein n=1 Tax=Oryza meridionalis TaxID=40149 RepID=A0A0E0DBQ9_9ORYZ
MFVVVVVVVINCLFCNRVLAIAKDKRHNRPLTTRCRPSPPPQVLGSFRPTPASPPWPPPCTELAPLDLPFHLHFLPFPIHLRSPLPHPLNFPARHRVRRRSARLRAPLPTARPTRCHARDGRPVPACHIGRTRADSRYKGWVRQPSKGADKAREREGELTRHTRKRGAVGRWRWRGFGGGASWVDAVDGAPTVSDVGRGAPEERHNLGKMREWLGRGCRRWRSRRGSPSDEDRNFLVAPGDGEVAAEVWSDETKPEVA